MRQYFFKIDPIITVMESAINTDFKAKFIPARICDGKELLIKYYAWHPSEQKLKKITKRFNHLRGKMNRTDILRYMRGIVNQINIELAQGKNPFVSAESPKAYTRLSDAIEMFLKIKNKELRRDGMRSYNSFCKTLLEWCTKKGINNTYVFLFKKSHALDYMNELTLRDNISNRTWNNYLSFNKGLWNWFIQNEYCKDNPFFTFEKKREKKKKRILIPQKTTDLIMQYCETHDRNMEIVIDLVRSAFIRPAELCLIQIKEINTKSKVIIIPGDKAKNHCDRFAYLPDWLCKKIESRSYSKFPPNFYMFSKRLIPGESKIDTRALDKHWAKIRDNLSLEKEMQLYSYRDTGITYLEEKGVPRNVIQKLTDHHSEKMVGKYIHQPNSELLNDVVSKIDEKF